MITLILFLTVVWLLIWSIKSVSVGTVVALIAAAVAFYYHRKWEKLAQPEKYRKDWF